MNKPAPYKRFSAPFREFFTGLRDGAASFLQSFKELVSEIVKFISEDLWKYDYKNISHPKGRKYLRIALRVAGMNKRKQGEHIEAQPRMVKFKLGFYSTSLSFFTVLAIVPFIGVLFFVTKGFGIDSYLETVLHRGIALDDRLIDMLIKFGGNIVKISKNGLFGAVSFLFFMVTIFTLIFNIEKSFDDIWYVKKNRSFVKQLLYVIGFLFIAPFVLIPFLAVGVTVNNALGEYGVKIWHFEHLSRFLQWLMFYGIVVVAFTVMNKFIPNKAAKVRWRAAFYSSLITSFAFVIVQFLYTGTQMMVTRLNAVYGALAAFPLFLVWLNICWTIILIGAMIAQSFQREIQMQEQMEESKTD